MCNFFIHYFEILKMYFHLKVTVIAVQCDANHVTDYIARKIKQ